MSAEIEFRRAVLENGDELEVSADGSVRVQRRSAGRIVAEVDLDYPAAGVGGGSIVVSPHQRYAVVSMYSGQSEERYEIVSLENELSRVGGIAYEFGEFATYGFSDDEQLLIMALPSSCIDWWLPWDQGDIEAHADGSASFNFGIMRQHDIAADAISVHELRVRARDSRQPTAGKYDPAMNPRVLPDRSVELSMPWGDETLNQPIPSVVTFWEPTQR